MFHVNFSWFSRKKFTRDFFFFLRDNLPRFNESLCNFQWKITFLLKIFVFKKFCCNSLFCLPKIYLAKIFWNLILNLKLEKFPLQYQLLFFLSFLWYKINSFSSSRAYRFIDYRYSFAITTEILWNFWLILKAGFTWIGIRFYKIKSIRSFIYYIPCNNKWYKKNTILPLECVIKIQEKISTGPSSCFSGLSAGLTSPFPFSPSIAFIM